MSRAASTRLVSECEPLQSRCSWTAEVAAALLSAFCACGCDGGPPLGQVTGVVTLDDDPLPDATVIYQPQPSGPASHGITDEAGHYELMFAEGRPDAVIGTHRVTIETYRISLDGAGGAEEHPERLPPKYHAESQLFHDVAAGGQTIDLKLQSQ